MLYVNNNGTILPADSPSVLNNNRSYLYGDGIFESIRIRNGRPINLNNHIQRLLQGAKALKLVPSSFCTTEFFEEKIIELCKKSHIQSAGKCRLSLDRLAGGTYSPETNNTRYFIGIQEYESNHFELNKKGLEVDIYTDIYKHKSPISNFKTKNGLLYIMASLKAKESGLDELLISNERGGILEASSSNIFVVSNGVLYTPGLEEGCMAGTMRMQVINLALANGIKVYECNLLPQNMLTADEVFFTNAIKGLMWVSGYRTKRYFNNMSKRLVEILNKHWDEKLNVQT